MECIVCCEVDVLLGEAWLESECIMMVVVEECCEI